MTSDELVLPVDLTLPFLEQRNYLHGTTLLDALAARIPKSSAIVFKVSRRIESNRVRFVESEHYSRADLAATLEWRGTVTSGAIGVIPLVSTGVTERNSYDESQITKRLRHESRSVTFTGDSPFTLIGTLIPMFKALLGVEHQMTLSGQWMFTRLDLDLYPTKFADVTLRLNRVVGDALAKSEVLLQGKPVGSLYYSWVGADQAWSTK